MLPIAYYMLLRRVGVLRKLYSGTFSVLLLGPETFYKNYIK